MADCFCFANPSGFSFGPSQKGTICSSGIHARNVSLRLNVICSHLYTFCFLRWLVIGHPFEVVTLCYLFFVEKNKKQVCVRNLH